MIESGQKKLKLVYVTALLLVSAFIGGLLVRGGFGLGWMFGGMIGSALLSYFVLPKLKLGKIGWISHMRKMGQAILGVGIGSMLHFAELVKLNWILVDILIMVAISLILSFIVGIFYAFAAPGQSMRTAIFSTLPGGVGIMASVAKEHGANGELVAILQSLRVVLVVVLAPLFLHGTFFFKTNGRTLTDTNGMTAVMISPVLLTLALAVGGYFMAKKCKISSYALIGPLLLSILCTNLLPFASDFSIPYFMSAIGQLCLGLTIGHGMGSRLHEIKWTDLTFGIISVIFTVFSSTAAIIFFHYATDLDWKTAILSAAPGGAVEMIVLAQSLHAHLEVIVTAQVIRQVLVNALIPLWILIAYKSESMFEDRKKPLKAN
ncbi:MULTISPECIES: AbrB family transcriptional regulator [unclassified Paenibacillus]|uniref:AbrB family transcriptional regulator n=1 Tax=unclassified Paenibacillus TaxID=185978 RepID=UPI0021182D1B|nr:MULTISPECIES: AbrB family transcriptional regulator [unclassified Paenibacillus]